MEFKNELLTLMVTPAVLISACGLMILSTTNRYARVIDRIREIDRLLDMLSLRPPSQDRSARVDHARRQIVILRRRGRLLRDTMMSLVGAVAGFVAASISTVIAYGWLDRGAILPQALVMLGMCAFLFGAICLMMETHLSFRVTEADLAFTDSLQKQSMEIARESLRENFGE